MNKVITKKEIDRILGGFRVDSYNLFETFLSLAPALRGKYYWYALMSKRERDFLHTSRSELLSTET